MISAHGVSVLAGRATLLDEVDVRIAPGEVVAIIGPNGAGKSTLLAALAGDRRPDRGRVMLRDRNVATIGIAELARLRVVLPQRSQLSLAFTALEVVRLAGPAIDRTLAQRCLADVELAAFADRSFPTLSGGEQQRVQLARVLAQLAISPAAALLLDEPTSALDHKHQQLVLGLARRGASAGHAVAIVVHDLTLAARWADRVVLLAGGKILADGAPSTVLTPATLRTAFATSFEILQGQSGVVISPIETST